MKPEEIIPIKNESAAPKESTPNEVLPDNQQQKSEREQLGALYRRIIPVNVTTVGKPAKFRDVFNLSGVINVSSTTVTALTDTVGTDETVLGSFTFFKDEWYPGMTLRITGIGTYTSDGTRTVTLRVNDGTTPTEYNSTTSTAGSTTNAPWHVVFHGIINTIGSAGTMEAQLISKINNVNKDDANTAAVALNTTQNTRITLTAQWSAATAGNTITIRQWIVEILN